MGFGYSGFGLGLSAFSIMFTIMFVLIIGVFIVTIVKGISTWNENNHSPRLTVTAEIADFFINFWSDKIITKFTSKK